MPRRSIHRRRRAQGGCLSFMIGVLAVAALALVVAIVFNNRMKPEGGRVPNLPAALDTLKSRGLWVYGTAADGTSPLWDTDLTGPAALVIGSEGDGMGRLVRESCDFTLSLPMKGRLNSLNASAAASIVMYEVLRQRSGGHS